MKSHGNFLKVFLEMLIEKEKDKVCVESIKEMEHLRINCQEWIRFIMKQKQNFLLSLTSS